MGRLDHHPFLVYSVHMMKMTSDSAIKTQINQIAAQLKWIKAQQANASKNNLPHYVKMFQNDRNQLTQLDVVPIGSSPDDYAAYLRTELERWTKVVKTVGIKVE